MSTELYLTVAVGVVAVAGFFLCRGGGSKPSTAAKPKPVRAPVVAKKPLPPPKEYTAEEVAKHNKRDDLWLIVEGKVFDVSSFVDTHPGGDAILKYPGQDNTKTFFHMGHPDSVRDQLNEYFIGTVKA